MKNKKGIILITSIIIVVMSLFLYSVNVNADLSEGIMRLHIIANSDSEYDQWVKIQVRDAVLAKIDPLLNGSTSQTESKQILMDNRLLIENTAREKMQEINYDKPVRAEFGNYYFPIKQYGNVTLPSGDYDACRIVIGDGSGQNWWCVMFPPLCFAEDMKGTLDDENLSVLKNTLTEDEYNMITNDEDCEFVVRFKIVDTFQKLKQKIKEVNV